MTPEEERYRYLKLKEKQATAKPEAQPVKTPAEEPGLMSQAADFAMRYVPGTRQSIDRMYEPTPTFADGVRSGIQGLTLGGGDEAAAAVEAPFRALGDGTSIKKAYEKTQAELQPAYDQAVERAPQMMIASGFLTGNTEKTAAKTAFQKFAPALKTIGMGAATGTLMAKPGERTKGGLIGAGVAGLTHGVVSGGAGSYNKLSQYLRSFSEGQAAKAVGLRGGISNAAQKLGIKDAAGVRQLGREALDGDLIPFAGSKDAVLKRAAEKKRQVGPAIDSYFEQGDKLAPPGSPNAMNYDDALVAGMGVFDDVDEVALTQRGKADDLLDAWANARDQKGGFLETRKMNTSANKLTPLDKSKEVPIREELFQDVKEALRGNSLNQLEKVLPEGELEGLKAVNKVYSTARKVEKLASNAGTREMANKSGGLIGTIEAQDMPGPMKFIWPRVKSVLDHRGPAAFAVGANGLAATLSKLQDPQRMVSPRISKLAAFVAARAQIDPDEGAAYHQALLSEDPEYAKAAAQP